MSIRLFNIPATPAGGSTTEAALQNLNDLNAVNRFDNSALVAGTSADANYNKTIGAGSLFDTNGDVTLDDTERFEVTNAGNYVIANATVTLNGDSAIRAAANGVHFYFVNCRIIVNGDNSVFSNPRIGTNQATNNASAVGASVDLGEANSRSINLLGCELTLNTGTAYAIADMFYSTVYGNDGYWIVSQRTADRNGGDPLEGGSRWVLNTFQVDAIVDKDTARTGRMHIDSPLHGAIGGAPGSRGNVLDGTHLRIAEGASQQNLFEGVQFENPFAITKWDCGYNDTFVLEYADDPTIIPANRVASDLLIQAVDYTTPPSNNYNELLGTATTFVTAQATGGTPRAGLMNLLSWRPRFFNDLAGLNANANDTPGIENVRIRLNTSAGLQANRFNGDDATYAVNSAPLSHFNSAYTGRVAAGLGGTPTRGAGRRNPHNDFRIESYFLTDNTGRPTLRGAEFSFNNDATDGTGGLAQDERHTRQGYVNWLRARWENTNGAGNENVIYENYSGQNTLPGELIVPSLILSNGGGVAYSSAFEARSASHNIHIPERIIQGTVGNDVGELPPSSRAAPIINNQVAEVRPGWNTTDNDTTIISNYDLIADKTVQDIYHRAVSEWSTYNTDIIPTVTTDSLIDFGNNTDLEFYAADLFPSEPGYNVQVAGAISNQINFGQIHTTSIDRNANDPIQGIRARTFAFASETTIGFNIEATENRAGRHGIGWENNYPSTLIDGGDVNGSMTLPSGTYTIRNSNIANLDLTRLASGAGTVFLNLENCTGVDEFTVHTDVQIVSNLRLNISGGSVGNGHFIVYNTSRPLSGSRVIASGSFATADATVSGASSTEFAQAANAGDNVRVYWVSRGYNVYISDEFALVGGDNTHTITPVTNQTPTAPVTDITVTSTVAQWQSGDFEVRTTNGGTGVVDSALVGEFVLNLQLNASTDFSTLSASDAETSGWLADVIYGDSATAVRALTVIAHRQEDTSYAGNIAGAVYQPTTTSGPAEMDNTFVRFRPTGDQQFRFGHVLNSNPNPFEGGTTAGTLDNNNDDLTYRNAEDVSGRTVIQSVEFNGAPSAFDLSALDAALSASVQAIANTQTNQITDSLNHQFNNRHITPTNVQRLGQLRPVDTTDRQNYNTDGTEDNS